MAIRLRLVKGSWVALCAVESDAKKDDIYLDDGQHYALSCKFARERIGHWEDKKINKLMDSQKMRNAETELTNWLNNKEK